MTKQFTDQLNRTITLPVWPPRRIVSLVPSQTELLYDLGLEEEVVGITKFCVHPASWFQTKTRVGGTKTLNDQKIMALQPDLLIGNKEENERSQVEALAERCPVWMSDIKTLEEAYDMIGRIGQLTGKETEAQQLVGRIRSEFAGTVLLPGAGQRLTAAYFIWRKPYMIAGGDTFIHEMLGVAGFENVFADASRYPEISLDDLSRTQPEVILLSSEPYPFAPKHLETFREACPRAQVRFVDGEMFSWYGSRLLYAGKYFQQLRESLNLA